MNKAELVRAIAAQTGLKAKDIEVVIKSFTNVVIDAVARGEKVSLIGFGSFSKITRKARQGLNPSTKEKMQIPEKTVPKFTPGKLFQDNVKK
ncbi:MAG: HU family DNA-binding protein [Candidatus Electryoneaceae bacterium]|nr:HU family DNA-binding protein [Candidatus Electryoneaceae bacterium]